MGTTPTPILIPYVDAPGDGEARWSFGTLTSVKATGDQTGGRFALIEDLAPRGDGTPLHHHPDDESFCILAGEVEFTLGDAAPVVAPPDPSSTSPPTAPTPSRSPPRPPAT